MDQNERDKYLINDGVKRCRQCDERKFSVDFANSGLFGDGKLPVCIPCYRSIAGQAQVMLFYFEKECGECGRSLNLAEFSIIGIRAQNSLPHMNDVCRECSSASFAGVKFGCNGGDGE